ncbi:hypothetical protein PIB30_015341 [Stylosanthes scabra]|uniref:PPM-type phosphatase domain-containing protein n=1 Tax=Stylosanthes scabra TaxID=79078 RepID=A0ABU6Q7T1_9FABA|nr:hypothetical protein [Stylosanthes scabra]
MDKGKGKSLLNPFKNITKDPNLWSLDISDHYCGQFSYSTVRATDPHTQDYSQVEISSKALYIGIYDGHCSPHTAQFLSENLFRRIVDTINSPRDMSVATFSNAIATIERQYLEEVWNNQHIPKILESGSCCLMAFLYRGNLIFVNVGDSGISIGHGSGGSNMLTNDFNITRDKTFRKNYKETHSDNDPKPWVKIAGIRCMKGISGIHVTRAVGTACLKEERFRALYRRKIVASTSSSNTLSHPLPRAYITLESDTLTYPLVQQDRHIIFASGGFWDLMTHRDASKVVFENKREGIARKLIKEAIKRGVKKRDASTFIP